MAKNFRRIRVIIEEVMGILVDEAEP